MSQGVTFNIIYRSQEVNHSHSQMNRLFTWMSEIEYGFLQILNKIENLKN